VELLEPEKDNHTETPEAVVPVAPEPRPKTAIVPINNEHGQSWPQIIAAILVAIVLIILLVLLARWIYHRTHQNTTNSPGVSQKATLNSSSAKNQSSAPNSSSGTNNANPPAPNPSSTPNPSGPNNQKITNNLPTLLS
jgi:cytoskeletal protein RodZ